MKKFCRVKAYCTYIPISKNTSTVYLYAKCMRAIVYHFKVKFLCNKLYSVNITWVSKNMRRKYSGCMRRDCGFNLSRIDIQRLSININKNRLTVFPHDG